MKYVINICTINVMLIWDVDTMRPGTDTNVVMLWCSICPSCVFSCWQLNAPWASWLWKQVRHAWYEHEHIWLIVLHQTVVIKCRYTWIAVIMSFTSISSFPMFWSSFFHLNLLPNTHNTPITFSVSIQIWLHPYPNSVLLIMTCR